MKAGENRRIGWEAGMKDTKIMLISRAYLFLKKGKRSKIRSREYLSV
jgi:hypothetical protein